MHIILLTLHEKIFKWVELIINIYIFAGELIQIAKETLLSLKLILQLSFFLIKSYNLFHSYVIKIKALKSWGIFYIFKGHKKNKQTKQNRNLQLSEWCSWIDRNHKKELWVDSIFYEYIVELDD